MSVTFGLKHRQIKTIEAELEKFGNGKFDAKYTKYVWEKLGKELAWDPFTLALHYFEYLEECRSNCLQRESIGFSQTVPIIFKLEIIDNRSNFWHPLSLKITYENGSSTTLSGSSFEVEQIDGVPLVMFYKKHGSSDGAVFGKTLIFSCDLRRVSIFTHNQS